MKKNSNLKNIIVLVNNPPPIEVGLAKALLISLSVSGTTLRQNI